MKIHARLSCSLLVVTAVFITGIIALHAYNSRRVESFVQLRIHEKNTLYDKILKLENSSLETFVYDFSRSVDIADFIRSGSAQIARQHVLPVAESFNVDALWIYRPDMSLIHTYAFNGAMSDVSLPESPVLVKELSLRPFQSFFIKAPEGYVQIIAAPIQPPEDIDRITRPKGYLFAGRLWDSNYLDEISALTESTIRIEHLEQEAGGVRTSTGRDPWDIRFTRPLIGPDKRFIAQIVVTSQSPLIKELIEANRKQLLLVLAFSTTILVVLFFISRKVLQRPLRLISTSLVSDNPAVLEPLRQSDTEFGTIAGLIITFFQQKKELTREIAERIRAEEALQRFRFMVENAGQEIYLVNPDGSLEYVNQAAAASLGYTRDEMLALGVYGFDPDIGPNYRRHFEILKTTDLPPFITMHRAKNGKKVYKEIKASYLRIGGREFVCGLGQDITERLRVQEEIKSSRDLLENIFKTSPDIIIWVNTTGEIITVNDAVAALTGYTASELSGESIAIFLPEREEDRYAIRAMVIAFYETGFIKGREIFWRRKDGSLIPLECNGTAIRDDRQEVTGGICILRDISDRKKIEEQLRQRQKMEAIGTLSGGIAHDFNNILGAIIGYAELAQATVAEGSETMHDLNQILKASDRARELVRQILTFSRKADSVRRPVRMHAIVQESLKLLRASIPPSIVIRPIITPDNDTVIADSTQMHQIIMNICTNAAQAMQETGGTLELRLAPFQLEAADSRMYGDDLQPGPYVQLSISDTGCGIARENLSRIFDPFFTTKEVGKGTGMGLAVVHGIVKSHAGAMQVYSEPGAGTTFHIILPCAVEQQHASAEPDEAASPIPRGTERILLIDDEPMLLRLGEIMLKSLDYKVTATQSSPAALAAFQNNPYGFDLIITDQNMPDKTGGMLAQECLAIRPDIPIILCTGYSKKISEERARHIGIRAYLMKPLNRRVLAESIRSVLDTRDTA